MEIFFKHLSPFCLSEKRKHPLQLEMLWANWCYKFSETWTVTNKQVVLDTVIDNDSLWNCCLSVSWYHSCWVLSTCVVIYNLSMSLLTIWAPKQPNDHFDLKKVSLYFVHNFCSTVFWILLMRDSAVNCYCVDTWKPFHSVATGFVFVPPFMYV